MNINGIGSQSALSWFDRRAKEKEEQQQQQAKVEAKTQTPVTVTNDASFQAEQAFEESFAKLRFSLQSTDTSTSSNSVTSSNATQQTSDAGYDARQAFSDYMNMTDAEKVRASMLQEAGLTEEEFEQMTPEQQAAVSEKIAERLKDKIEQKINEQAADSPTAEQLLAS